MVRTWPAVAAPSPKTRRAQRPIKLGLRRLGLRSNRTAVRTSGSGAAAVAILVGSAARAQAPVDPAAPQRPIAEAVQTDAPCLTREALTAQLASWLGRGSIDARLEIAVVEGERDASFTVKREGSVVGERTLHLASASCDERRAAVGLAIAVAIDATLLATLGITAPEPPRPVDTPASPPSRPRALPRAARRPPPKRPRVHVDVAAEGQVVVAVLPSVAFGVSPAFTLTIADIFDVRVAGLATADTRTRIGVGRAETRLVAGRLDACAGRTAGRVRFRGCLGVGGGPILTAGSDYPVSHTSSAPWVAAVARFEGRWAFTPVFGASLALDGYLPAVRPRLDVEGPRRDVLASRDLPPAGFGVALGPSVTIW
jgi:hypothetical protein